MGVPSPRPFAFAGTPDPKFRGTGVVSRRGRRRPIAAALPAAGSLRRASKPQREEEDAAGGLQGLPTIVDLSQELFQGQPVYPGHPPTLSFPVTHVQHRPDGRWTFAVGGLLLSEHAGTHTDGFVHMDDDPQAPSVDRLPLGLFLTPGFCADLSGIEPGATIRPADLEAAGCEVPRGGAVLIHTGHYGRTFPTPAYLQRYAGLGRAAMEWLAERGAVNVGVDTPSVDPAPDPPGEWKPAHAVCRERRVLNTENLGDLRPVAGRRFLYVGLPLRVRGGTAGPTRAAAVLFEDGGSPAWLDQLREG